jgi:hypothetical protein
MFDGLDATAVSVSSHERGSTPVLVLEAGAPNPFRAMTSVTYFIPRQEIVRLSLHDVTGRLVAVLAEGLYAPGRHVASWDGYNSGGAAAAAGVYFLRLEAGGAVRTQKVVLAR